MIGGGGEKIPGEDRTIQAVIPADTSVIAVSVKESIDFRSGSADIGGPRMKVSGRTDKKKGSAGSLIQTEAKMWPGNDRRKIDQDIEIYRCLKENQL
ncbi:hypothetical protein CDAR_443011 [Caerostris darwini]|uniref:Uncharacterized protein n=1 Tax=Caerostris darwini TaxID=1538125 RepID=A0AAV4VMP3_9ARAC|nr:hypothetical protein CDAR_443011 [Caerostris darwini]